MEKKTRFTNPLDKRKHDLFIQKVGFGFVKFTDTPLSQYRAEQVAKKLVAEPDVLDVMAIPVARTESKIQVRRKKVA